MIQSAVVKATVRWGISYWEVHGYDQQGSLIKIINFPLAMAKRLGVTKTLRGTKKMNNWLNSEKGLQMLNQTKGEWFTEVEEDNHEQ
ncbi:hypothetical protein [Pontibacillus salipaludis]|uniref:Uncharacterized protein n=1 Tax=Pontibacillus salipaludis TaxID=1697394 RepID=A0ABQ1PW87_9BACI|nr:hypothetical protein [Pontibacillus salipaludis]GGD05210.1 hypothetical protein GCM10011389_10900 [Pontibacillus salipaludis]